jgi:hypothetical protein
MVNLVCVHVEETEECEHDPWFQVKSTKKKSLPVAARSNEAITIKIEYQKRSELQA